MDTDEKEVCAYLKSCPGQFISLREICRRAGGKRRYREDESWAAQAISRLVEKNILEADSTGHYRLRAAPQKKKKKFLSPQIRKILEEHGGQFEHVFEIEDEDDEY